MKALPQITQLHPEMLLIPLLTALLTDPYAAGYLLQMPAIPAELPQEEVIMG